MAVVTSDQVATLVRELRSACFNLAGVGIVGRAEIQRLLSAVETILVRAVEYGHWQPEVTRKGLEAARDHCTSARMHAQVSPEWENVRPLFEELFQIIGEWEIPKPPPHEDETG